MRLSGLRPLLIAAVSSALLCGPALGARKGNERGLLARWLEVKEALSKPCFEPLNFDPFAPFVKSLRPAPVGRMETVFFEDYSLNELRLVGIVEKGGDRLAMIEDPSGKALFLRVGQRLGRTRGKIVKITPCEVHVEETYLDYRGRLVKRSSPRILSLYGEESCETD